MQVGECPLWHPAENCLYWIDIAGFAIHRLHPTNGAHHYWPMPSEPGAIAYCASGGLIVALRNGFAWLDTNDKNSIPQPIASAAAPYDTTNMRFNDGRCDAAGRFWVGTLYEPRTQAMAAMTCLERGEVRVAWSGGMTVSNGLAFSPDQRYLYHADTTSHTIRRYDFDLASGQVSHIHHQQGQIFKQFSSNKNPSDGTIYGGRPDGAAVDSEGAYWCAMFEGARLLRISPTGEILRDIALPVRCPTMPAFGGPDMRTLYITSARHQRSVDELQRYPLSGCILSLRVDVAGQVEHAYRP